MKIVIDLDDTICQYFQVALILVFNNNVLEPKTG
jgi:predicted secreted acid phosphatase